MNFDVCVQTVNTLNTSVFTITTVITLYLLRELFHPDRISQNGELGMHIPGWKGSRNSVRYGDIARV